MCVICVANTERPSAEQVIKMYQNNPHGAGIAWREEEEGANVVVWRKGLSVEEIVELCEKAPLPFVAHFRVPSCGGPSNLLTHPFPIQKDVPLTLEGSSKGNILFHNGHWGAWKNTVMDASVRGGWTLPKGKWSDSRAMAWMAAHFGLGMLEFIDEKVVVFGPNELELFQAHGWSKIGTGMWVSNRGWESEHVQWNRAPFYGNRPKSADGAKKKDDAAAPADDSEDPSSGKVSEMAGSKRVESGDGTQKRALTLGASDVSSNDEGSEGVIPAKGPFAEYRAAVRLWQTRDIGKKSFRRARRKYEAWCKKNKKVAEPPPSPADRAQSIH